jgi:hypothetical protein
MDQTVEKDLLGEQRRTLIACSRGWRILAISTAHGIQGLAGKVMKLADDREMSVLSSAEVSK